jgi:indole-3-glycerol phosphate synthase
LETLLDACTIMGTEAVVEVHTPNELEFALSKGATIFLVNMWDRMTGKLFPDQVYKYIYICMYIYTYLYVYYTYLYI